jgi:hypothetical protein
MDGLTMEERDNFVGGGNQDDHRSQSEFWLSKWSFWSPTLWHCFTPHRHKVLMRWLLDQSVRDCTVGRIVYTRSGDVGVYLDRISITSPWSSRCDILCFNDTLTYHFSCVFWDLKSKNEWKIILQFYVCKVKIVIRNYLVKCTVPKAGSNISYSSWNSLR